MISPERMKEIEQFEEALIQTDVGYDAFRNALACHQAQISRSNRTQEADYWKVFSKRVTEPGYIKYVLSPLGVSATLLGGTGADYMVGTVKYDLKVEFAPFFNNHPTYSRSVDRTDVFKYDDDVMFEFLHSRVPGMKYRYKPYNGEAYPKWYTCPAVVFVCRTSAATVRKIAKQRGLVSEEYTERKLEVNSSNEKERFVFDIRWFEMLWRYEGGVWIPSSWTQEELGLEEEDDETPIFVSKKAAEV